MGPNTASFLSNYGFSALGALTKIGGAIGTGIAAKRTARRAMRRTNAQLNAMEQRANREYEDQYYADPTATAANQNALSQMQTYLRDKRKASAGAAAVTGGSTEAIAAEKANDNAALANTMGNIAANGTAQQQRVRDMHNQALDSITNTRIAQIDEYNKTRQANIANAAANINSIGDSISQMGANQPVTKPSDFQKK